MNLFHLFSYLGQALPPSVLFQTNRHHLYFTPLPFTHPLSPGNSHFNPCCTYTILTIMHPHTPFPTWQKHSKPHYTCAPSPWPPTYSFAPYPTEQEPLDLPASHLGLRISYQLPNDFGCWKLVGNCEEVFV